MRLRVEVHMVEPGNCTVYTVERDGSPWLWNLVDQVLNFNQDGASILLPERPVGEHCNRYHIYAAGGLVHDA